MNNWFWEMMKLFLVTPRTKTVLEKPIDFCETTCDAYGHTTLITVDVTETRSGAPYPVRLQDDERPGSIQIISAKTGDLLHSVAPPSTFGPRGLEIGALVFSTYVKEEPKNVIVLATGAVEKYGVLKVTKTDTRR